jgi:hypothetical protein
MDIKKNPFDLDTTLYETLFHVARKDKQLIIKCHGLSRCLTALVNKWIPIFEDMIRCSSVELRATLHRQKKDESLKTFLELLMECYELASLHDLNLQKTYDFIVQYNESWWQYIACLRACCHMLQELYTCQYNIIFASTTKLVN